MRDPSSLNGLFDHKSSIQQDHHESFESLSPDIKLAFSYPVELAKRDGTVQRHSIEEIVDIAVSRCQNLLFDDGTSGSKIVQILDGMAILAAALHLENSRYLTAAQQRESTELTVIIGCHVDRLLSKFAVILINSCISRCGLQWTIINTLTSIPCVSNASVQNAERGINELSVSEKLGGLDPIRRSFVHSCLKIEAIW